MKKELSVNSMVTKAIGPKDLDLPYQMKKSQSRNLLTNVTASHSRGALDLGFGSRDAEGASDHSNTTAGIHKPILKQHGHTAITVAESPRKSARTEGPLVNVDRDIVRGSS